MPDLKSPIVGGGGEVDVVVNEVDEPSQKHS
jgi:hypothetical protein